MAQRIVDEASLTSLGDTIREKGGTSDLLTFPDGMRDAILAIPSAEGWEQMVRKSQTITGSTYVSSVNPSGNAVSVVVTGSPTNSSPAFNITYDVTDIEEGVMYEFFFICEREGEPSSGQHICDYASVPCFVGKMAGNYAASRFGSLWCYDNNGTRIFRSYGTQYGIYPYKFVPSTGVLTVYVRVNTGSACPTGSLGGTYKCRAYKRKLAL